VGFEFYYKINVDIAPCLWYPFRNGGTKIIFTIFNDDNTTRGIEGKYAVSAGTLILYAEPTNSRADWFYDFLSFPVYSRKLRIWCHAGYRKYAEWLFSFISSLRTDSVYNIHSVVILGYSMGGGIAQIVGRAMNAKTVSIDGPRTTFSLPENMTLYYKRGSVVNLLPPWFARCKKRICVCEKWRPVWVSHVYTGTEIDAIIERESGL
jgi:pimeloyl-ACP methyl ester carboxylesterase